MASTKLMLTVLLVAVAAVVMGLFAGVLSQQAAEPNMGPVEEKLYVGNCSAVKDTQGLTIKLTLRDNVEEAVQICDLRINSVPLIEFWQPTIQVNGTTVSGSQSPLFVVSGGDTVDLTLFLPMMFLREPYDSGFVKLEFVTPEAVHYAETTYP